MNHQYGEPRNLTYGGVFLFKKHRQSICSVKFGRQTILSLGLERITELLTKIRGYGFTTIIDDKLNDIDETNAAITRAYFNLGFNAITFNPFAGWKGGFETRFKFAHKNGMRLLAL